MKRSAFLSLLASMPFAKAAFAMNTLNALPTDTEQATMPVLFVGHGSPMNAIEENQFVRGWRDMIKGIPTPKAILCVSAHWETRGTKVTAMENPKTIHDFGGFPKALFDVQYPAPGSPIYAKETQIAVKSAPVALDYDWGLDHGAWSVIKQLYPNADIPVFQMSLDYTKSPNQHWALGQELSALRKKGVLIIGSGNIIHNLRLVAWDKLNVPNFGHDWAIEANAIVHSILKNGDFKSLANYEKLGKSVQLAVPSPDHYLPLLYILGLKTPKESITLYNDTLVGGALSMTSLKIA